MSNKNTDPLFQLIKSLTKAEKRYFKLHVNKQTAGEDTKFLKLFDLIDKQKDYDESKILEKDQSIKSQQLSNLKAHLYKQILQNLRGLNSDEDLDIRLHEFIDHATILYNKCLYDQCVKMLEKAKNLAEKNDKNTLLLEITEFEKRLVTKYIRSNIEDKVSQLIKASDQINDKINNINTFSNLTIKLYSFYLKIGFLRNHKDFELVNSFLYSTLPVFQEEQLSFDEKMYLYNSFVGYYFFIQDFERGYEYAKKWVNLFDEKNELIIPKIEMYIRSINNLLVSQSKLHKYEEFKVTVQKLDSIKEIPDLRLTENIRLLLFKYSATHRINRYFMLGEFSEGSKIIPEIAKSLEDFELLLDTHYIIIFYYKFACMYFGNSDYQKVVFWLNKIINMKDVDLRSDIHSFARILNLISHYELGNLDLVDYYIRSTYRFLIKKNDLHLFQKIIMKFLRKLSSITRDQLIDAFKDLREQLLPLNDKFYERRPFIYFDIISWLESKIENRDTQEVIREKALKKISNNV
ncbi:MAG TPA: hypothetical protein DCG75_10015 [Bacteroidales bacterium]|jgi:hypothetical protein|nr:hypothetical protein [Bacteroidales bacterium]